ncbi:MAG: DUF507 family protein [Candidatus Korobacteraceae bacterium]|jgi:hypothetical protein
MRLSHDKVSRLTKSVFESLREYEQLIFVEDPQTIRQEIRAALEHLLTEEEGLDKAARQKIESQKRTIVEGTQEWDILYRKYYSEEVKKLGIS